MTSLMGGFPWNEYNWHRRSNQYLLDRQFGYFRHDGNRPVQATPVYPYVDGVDLPYGNKQSVVLIEDCCLVARKLTYLALGPSYQEATFQKQRRHRSSTFRLATKASHEVFR